MTELAQTFEVKESASFSTKGRKSVSSSIFGLTAALDSSFPTGKKNRSRQN